MECNEYLELGNELERENKILMACAVYLEAIKNSSGEHKEIVKKYVEILSHKISENNSERNHEVKQQLLEWKMEGRLACAIKCYVNIFNNIDGENWIDEDNAILYHCINIYYLEEKYSDFSLDIKNAGIEELKKWYYSLKYIIRRVDMDIYEEEEIVEYIKKEKISLIAIYYLCNIVCFHFDRAYKNFTKMFANYDMKDYELALKNLYEENNREEQENVAHNNTEHNKYMDVYKNKLVTKEKIAFILAVNEEEMYKEALYYIQHLKVPENMEVEVIPIRGAASATSAYNQGMKLTDAKYKVYMHQDIMIVNPYMIYEILAIFQNKEIGMIGVAGPIKIPENGIWWEDKERYMKIYQDLLYHQELSDTANFNDAYAVVEAIDGVMMVTQYDIPWREDIFTGWHFYDISQSMEFNRKKLKVVVAAQTDVWCLHEQRPNKSFHDDYNREKEKFLKEYKNRNINDSYTVNGEEINILILHNSDIQEISIQESFQRLGIDVIQRDKYDGKSGLDKFAKELQKKKYHFVFSVNFYPHISEVCKILKVTYISWIVDSSMSCLDSESVKNPNNKIFISNREQWECVKDINPEHIFYLPLGTDIWRNEAIIASITDFERETFLSNVSEVDDSYTKRMKNVIYHLSKINLNLVSETTISGLSQNIWDIMGSGGFLLTRYQEELEDYFVIGEDLDVFSSEEELEEKMEYYLKHDAIREKIARSGYEKVRKYHSYDERMKQMMRYLL